MPVIERLAAEVHERLVTAAVEAGWKKVTRRQISSVDVQSAFHIAAAGRSHAVDHPEEALRACIDVLVSRSLLRPMRKMDKERTPMPVGYHLLPVASPPDRVTIEQPIWHPGLYDIGLAWPRMSRLQQERHVAVNRWLKSHSTQLLVPARERALEVFVGHGNPECHKHAEKAFDTPGSGPLFGDEDRLFSLLRMYRTAPPLLSESILVETEGGYLRRIGSGDLLLVIENSTTWTSLVEALDRVREHRVGHVAWGLGSSFIRSIRSITDRHHVSEIRYFGDLDVSGVRIASTAAAVARSSGLPPVVPARNLYAALIAAGKETPSKEAEFPVDAEKIAGWLWPEHREPILQLFSKGTRIAQEWVGKQYLSQSDDWHQDLT